MKNIHKLLVQFSITVLATTVLVACSKNTAIPNAFDDTIPNELQDMSIYTGQPCKAPCWFNLLPDSSSKQEAIEVLSNLSFINAESISYQDAQWWGNTLQESLLATLILAKCIEPSTKTCVQILIVEDKVKYIMLYPNYGITIDELVSYFGVPDYISPAPYGAECLGCLLDVNWVMSPLEIIASRDDKRCSEGAEICEMIWDSNKIPHNLQIDSIIYQGSVPAYRQTPREHIHIQWEGFSTPQQ